MKENLYKILSIIEEGYEPGLRLAGSKTKTVQSAEEMQNVIEEVMKTKEYGIVLVEESLFEKIGEKHRKKYNESALPLIMPLHLRETKRIPAEEYMRELVRRVLGYSIRIK